MNVLGERQGVYLQDLASGSVPEAFLETMTSEQYMWFVRGALFEQAFIRRLPEETIAIIEMGEQDDDD